MFLARAMSKSNELRGCGGKMAFVDPAQGGWWMDPSDDNGSEERTDPSPNIHVHPWFPELDADEGWITSEALGEVLMLEAMFIKEEIDCPRCGCTFHSYGILQLCSQGCPENMRAGRASN